MNTVATKLHGFHLFQKNSPPLLLMLCLLLTAGCVHNETTKRNDKVGTAVDSNHGTTIVPAKEPIQTAVPRGSSVVTAIAAGKWFTVALKSDGKVVAWGETRLGSGRTIVPVDLSGVMAIAAGLTHGVALRSNGTVVTWGSSGSLPPVPANLDGVKAIAAGFNHTVALKSNGTVVVWGEAIRDVKLDAPTDLTEVEAIASGWYHILALKSNGTVVAWGGYPGMKTEIAPPAGLDNVRAVSASVSHSMALKSNGTVISWGWNSDGQTNVPTDLSGVTAIAAGRDHSVALKSDGTVVAWGGGKVLNYGQAVVPTGLSGVKALAAGHGHTVVLKNDGTIVGWGDNSSGQASAPASLNSDAPTPRLQSTRSNPDAASPLNGLPSVANEVDMLTFIKAFAEGKAAGYQGYKVLGGGASGGGKAGEEGNYLVVLVCGKRPSGDFFQIAETAGGNYNFDGGKDELFAVQLEFKTLPPGTSQIAMLLGGGDLCKSFVARFNGKTTTASLSTNGQENRQVRVPVLVWEAKGAAK